jgi:peptidoglycan/LPS O-acetylase OafA/YrhL
MIVIGHLTFYLAMPQLMAFSVLAADNFLFLFGLTLFFFVSGFVLQYNYGSIETKDTVPFLKKRLVRIYPLYWLSIITSFLLQAKGIGQYALSSSSLLIHALGLQAILAPRFIDPILTNWFVGVILVFYLIFPLLMYLSNKGMNIITASFLILLPLIALRIAFDIIDFRFFLYYGIFVAGILASRYDVMHRHTPQLRFLCISTVLFAPLYAYVGIIFAPQLVHAVAYGLLFNENPLTYLPAGIPLPVTFALFLVITLNLLMLLFVYVVFTAARLSAHTMRKMTLNLLLAIAFSAYCLYLFNRQVFDIGHAILHVGFHLTSIQIDVGMVVLVVPILFAFSYWLQTEENKVIKRIRSRRAT